MAPLYAKNLEHMDNGWGDACIYSAGGRRTEQNYHNLQQNKKGMPKDINNSIKKPATQLKVD